jgi:hypothetical protein
MELARLSWLLNGIVLLHPGVLAACNNIIVESYVSEITGEWSERITVASVTDERRIAFAGTSVFWDGDEYACRWLYSGSD